jgi:hypothetical protein
MGFARDFVGRMWKDLIAAGLFLLAFAILAHLVGLVLFCVGVYAASALCMMVHGHLLLQLYELYLSRGGQPIPLKTSVPPV